MKINIQTIPHDEQRYPTVGDWYHDPDGTLRIMVSKMGNEKYEALVIAHELVEALTCYFFGVTADEVDAYDMAFEKNRKPGDETEPGDYPHAPYYIQHQLATAVERVLAFAWRVDWTAYEKAINAL